jgi:hypothetical protein
MIKHKHHIIPKHAGGTDDPSNLIELTIEEHAEAHRLLFEEHGRYQDKIAWKMLSGQISVAEATIQSIKEYMTNRIVKESAREKLSKNMRERNRVRGHPMLGKKFSLESRQKMSDSHKGQIPVNKGKKCSQDQIEKNRQAQLNLSSLPCPVCNKLIKNPGNMKQHLRKHQKSIKEL